MKSAVGLVMAGLVVGGAACSDSGAPATDEFVGTWDALKIEFTRVADTTVKEDIFVTQNARMEVTFFADSTWQSIETIPPVVDTVGGTWMASIDVLTLTQTGQAGNQQFTFVLSGNTVTLTGGDTDWDFGMGGGDEAAKLSLTLVKR
jgi:hypothetical protein